MPIPERELDDIRNNLSYKMHFFHLKNVLDENDLTQLAEALETNTHLEEIVISKAYLNAHGLSILTDILKTHPSIKRISLDSNHLGPDGAAVIADLLHTNPRITEINIWNNNIGPEGALVISEAIRNHPSLRKIDLSFNNIGDEGLNAISAIIPACSRNLTELKVYANNYTDVGIKNFADALESNIDITEIGNLENHRWVKPLITRNRRYIELKTQVAQGSLTAFRAIGSEYKDFADRNREITMPSLLQQNIYLLKERLLNKDKENYYSKISNLRDLLNLPHDLYDQFSPEKQFPIEFQFIHLLRQLEEIKLSSAIARDQNIQNTLAQLNILFLNIPQKSIFLKFLAETPELADVHNYLNSTPAIAIRTEHYLSEAKDKFATWVMQLKNNWKLPDAGFFSKILHKRADAKPIEVVIENIKEQKSLAPLQQLFSDTMQLKNRSTARNATAHNHSIISYFLNELKHDASAQKALGLTLEDVNYLLPKYEAARKQALKTIQNAKLPESEIAKPEQKI